MYPRILAKIRELVERGDYVLSIHAENELANDDLAERDLEAAISNGTIIGRERDQIGRAKYLITGRTQGGRELTAVVQLFQTRRLVVIITAYES